MIAQTTINKILDLGLSRGADFVEVFVEESETSDVDFLNQKIDHINSGNAFGVGIRLITGDESAYGYSSDADEDVLLQLTANLAREAKSGGRAAALQRQDVPDRHAVVIDPASVPKQGRRGTVAAIGSLDAAAWGGHSPGGRVGGREKARHSHRQ